MGPFDDGNYTVYIIKEYAWYPRRINKRWIWLKYFYSRHVIDRRLIGSIYNQSHFAGYLTDEEVLIHLLSRRYQ